jgi:predicted SPOUT superfamily RNA methylase MTH1
MKNNQYPKVTVTKSNSVSEIQLENDDNAKIFFEKLKNNLYNVNQWNELKSKESAIFNCVQKMEKKNMVLWKMVI